MKPFKIIYLLISVSFLSCSCNRVKENDILLEPDPKNYTTKIVVDDISVPWGMCWLPDGSMLITELNGELIHFKDDKKTIIKNTPEIYRIGQGGLMDIETHPNYVNNGWIYITYSTSEGKGDGGNTALIRAKLKDEKLTSIEKIYKGNENTTSAQHFGSRIRFDNKGYLYFSIGDRGERKINPQNIYRDGGKIYRLHDDGTIPKDNPFVSDIKAKHGIYSYGHRNPQGMIFNSITNEIWVHEHGPKGGDEINIIIKGSNYGWSEVTYGTNYKGIPISFYTQKEGMKQPIYYWTPSIAPSGMEFITSNLYPNWKNKILVGSLKFQYLELLELSGNKVITRTKLLEDIGRVRNVRQGPDGYIYVAVENNGILKIIPK